MRKSDTERRSNNWARVALVALLLILPAAYVASYFAISKPGEFFLGGNRRAIYRVFPSKAVAVWFRPMAKAEGLLRWRDCRVGWRDELRASTFVDPP